MQGSKQQDFLLWQGDESSRINQSQVIKFETVHFVERKKALRSSASCNRAPPSISGCISFHKTKF
jgi:hypothetical protein